MQPYANSGGNSGVSAYEPGEESITVQFKGGSVYLYTYQSAGAQHIEQMKVLAVAGQGLGSYINTHVRKAYASKLG